LVLSVGDERLFGLCFDKSGEEDPTARLDGIHSIAQGFHREMVSISVLCKSNLTNATGCPNRSK
jgi:hypothetical protein